MSQRELKQRIDFSASDHPTNQLLIEATSPALESELYTGVQEAPFGVIASQHINDLEEMMNKITSAIIGILISIFLVFQVSATEMDWSKPVLIEVPEMPKLPSGMSNLKLKGMTTVRIEITDMGLISNSQTVTSTGSENLDRCIHGWIKDWKYLPRLENNRPVGGFSVVVINFDLQKQSFQAPSPITEAILIPDVLATVLLQSGQSKNKSRHPDMNTASGKSQSSSGISDSADSERIAQGDHVDSGTEKPSIDGVSSHNAVSTIIL